MDEDAGDQHPVDDPGAETERAIGSLVEALRSIPDLQRRAAQSRDDALADVLLRQVDAQRELVAMLLEWLRQHDPALDLQLRAYLFQKGGEPAAEPLAVPAPVEAPAPAAAAPPPARGTALTLNPSGRIRG